MPKLITPEERAEIAAALETVQATQTAYWDALGELEGLVEGLDLDGTSDYEGYDVDDILALAEETETEDVI